jgi:uncharacterized membrane protein YeaQ/YmgE (transglycosylase-associated protein family)
VSVGLVISIIISGFFTGALARLAIPGPDPMPIWLTVAIGLTGSIVGAVVGNAIAHDNGYVIAFLSLGVAIALVAAYRKYVQRRPILGPEAHAFPTRGLGVDQQRSRLRSLGIDPDALRPDRSRLERARHEAMLRDLHRAGILDDDELREKLSRLTSQGSGTEAS